MSNLKDIMSVDVDPLESQAAYRRAASQQQAAQTAVDQRSVSPSLPLDPNNGKAPVKQRRSDRAPRPSSNSPIRGFNIVRRRSSAAPGEAMDFNSGYQAGEFNQASTSGSPQQSSRGSEQPTSESFPVKYTPVTGRISRAKKGVPVHTCDVCRPVKTFTRAEHLRRHQLSHQKPAYPCTFQDCERAFHRPDLLARHLHRHETQGEKAYKSTSSRGRRASSSASESRTPYLKLETSETSPTDSLTPRTSGSTEGSMTAFSAITSSFQNVNFSPVTGSHKRSASEAQLPGAGPYSPESPSSGTTARPPTSFGQITSSPFQSNDEINLRSGDHFSRASEQSFVGMYYEPNSPSFQNFSNAQSLPLLRIPEETYVPGLSHTRDNASFCSSESDSTYSTQSEGSLNGGNGPIWTMRGRRAHSISTTADWSASIGAPQWSPYPMCTTPQDIRSPPTFDSMPEHYETPSPRMTPLNAIGHLLDVPNSYGGIYMEAVGTPAYNKPQAQLFSASPTRISDSGLASIAARKVLVEPQSLGSLGALSLSPSASYQPLAQLDGYITSYWQSFDNLFPIIHRGTFDPAEDRLLSSAMAAMGTQYHESPQVRQRGIELNEYCRKSIGICENWNTATMQAILLTEIFTRFRGRKTNVETSHHFKELYSRLLNNPSRDQTPFSTHSSNVASGDSLLDPFSPHQTTQQSGLHTDWTQWAETQARQRLLAACFIFDVHQSLYHEQKRTEVHFEETLSMICLPCQDDIWNAPTAVEWQAKSVDCAVQDLPLIELDLSSQYVIRQSQFSQRLYICSLASRLPPREDPTYPGDFLPHSIDSIVMNLRTWFPASPLAHCYLALHHTPLHDLLAIAGDTWVFGKKITPSAFHSAQSRLKVWTSSLAAAAATQHACQIIATLLQPQSQELNCVSDYWPLYTAALICWAFGHRYSSSAPNGTLSSSTLLTTVDVSMDIDSPLAASPNEAKLKALTYINGMLELDTGDLLTSKASMRGDTVGVIDAVRDRLERDSVSGTCMMIIDAIFVLTRIKEGGRGKWF